MSRVLLGVGENGSNSSESQIVLAEKMKKMNLAHPRNKVVFFNIATY